MKVTGKKNFMFLLSLLLVTQQNAKPLEVSGLYDDNSHPYISIHFDDSDFEQQAEKWITTYICDNNTLKITPADIETIANLCYVSFGRSLSTILAQKAALHTLDIAWQGYQNITHTRMDPSQPYPYTLDYETQNLLFSNFANIQLDHKNIGDVYTYVVTEIASGKILDTISAFQAVETMRNNARISLSTLLADAKEYVTTFLQNKVLKGDIKNDLTNNQLEKKTKTTKKYFKAQKNTKRFALIDSLAKYLPQIALYSFVDANNLYLQASELAWNGICKVENTELQIWEKIEFLRASFYLAYYRALMNIIKQQELPHNIIFNQHGLIPQEEQTNQLRDF